MSLIGIVIFIVFISLLAKAIFETLWGICIIVHGIFWHGIAFILSALAAILRTIKNVSNTIA